MKPKDEAKRILEEKGMLNTAGAAKILGYSVAALKKWRGTGKGPIYYKGAGEMVFYSRADLEKFKKTVTLVRVVPRSKNTQPENTERRIS